MLIVPRANVSVALSIYRDYEQQNGSKNCLYFTAVAAYDDSTGFNRLKKNGLTFLEIDVFDIR